MGAALGLWPWGQIVGAQQIPLPGTEASPTLFSTQLGSPDVTLDLSGSWSAEVDGSLSWGLDSLTGRLYPAPFPGMVSGLQIQQIPNLDVTLHLLNHYLFRASFVEPGGGAPSPNLPANLNTFLLGYDGSPGDFLKSVRIGNTDVNIDQFNFVSFPDASPFSLGAAAQFGTDTASYQAMIRYEPSSLHKRIFVGHTEVSETRVNPGGYIGARFFVLPDSNIQNLIVYIEDGTRSILASDGHWYRLAASTDYSYSAANGTITFAKPLAGRALVYYTVNGAAVGTIVPTDKFLPGTNATTGDLDLTQPPQPFSWALTGYPASSSPPMTTQREVVVQAQNALLLYEPGVFSPFQSDATYSLSGGSVQAGTTVQASLVPNGADGLDAASQSVGAGGSPGLLASPGGQPLTVTLNAQSQLFTVIGPRVSGTQTPYDPRSLAARYPFASQGLQTIYSAGPNQAPQDVGQQVLVRAFTPVQSYVLDPNIIKGSVQVTRNGHQETDYSVDFTNGYLTFSTPVADSDIIIVTYRSESATQPGGDLLFGMGAKFLLLPGLRLDIGTGLRWSMFGGNYSTVEGVNTGSALLGAGLHFARDNPKHPGESFKADLQAGVSVSSPDTTGTFRLFGMEGQGSGVPTVEGSMYPSSAPDQVAGFGLYGQTDRGELLYKDFHLYSVGGSTLEPLDWAIPANQIYSYQTGNPTGPYPAYDSTEGPVMVMDYVMSPSQWVGAQVPLPGAPEDLTSAQSLQFAVKTDAASGSITAYVQIGAVSEDLDGDGKLESAGSAANNLFDFHDQTHAMTLLTGGGAPPGNQATATSSGSVLRSEDTNGNGILDLENPSLVASYAIPLKTTTGWQPVEFDFTPAERAALTRGNAIRIILVNSSGTDVTGRFEVSSFSIAGSPFHIQPSSPADNTTVQEISDPLPTGQQLTDRFPEVATVFHSGGQPQKVLNVHWTSVASSNAPWTLTGYPTPVNGSTYKRLVFYLLARSPTPSGSANLELDLTDQNFKGVHVHIPLNADGVWHKYSVALDGGTVSQDGSATSATATVDGRGARFTMLTLTMANASAGDISLDEVSLQGSDITLAAGATLSATYRRAGPLFSISGVPIVSDLKVTEESSVTGPGFASSFGSYPDSGSVSSYTEIAARLPLLAVDTNFSASQAGTTTTLAGGHSLTMPLGPLSLSDSYSQTNDGTLSSFSRSNGITFALPSLFSTTLTSSAVDLSTGLTQTIQGLISSSFSGPFSLSATTTLTNALDSFSAFSPLYFVNWADAYGLILPVDSASADRTAVFGFDANLRLLGGASSAAPGAAGATSVSLDLRPIGGIQSLTAGGRTQTSTATVVLSLPVTTPSGLVITPTYTRSWTAELATPSNDGFASDFSTYFGDLSSSAFVYNTVPVQELLSPSLVDAFAADTAGLATADYEPSLGLSLDRSAGSSLYDLFVPAHFALSLTRSLQRQGDTISDALSWQTLFRTDALNLFGSAGVFPLFKFYRTDEIATSVNVTAGSNPTDAVFQNLINLYMTGNREIDVTHRLEILWDTPVQVNDSVSTSFRYRIGSGSLFVLPYVPAAYQAGRYLENTETVTFTSAPDVVANSLQLNLSHETAMVLPNHGQIGATVGIGVQESNSANSGRIFLFGLQASIRADIAF